MSNTLARVIEIVSYQSGVPVSRLSAKSAIDQDVQISGDDIDELAEALAREFGDHVWRWPWQRYAELNEPSLIVILTLVPFERLELGHVAAVIDKGEWFEP